jgi:hypothetical protein
MATCIPYAFGVPWLGGPPNWGWTANTRIIDTVNPGNLAEGAIKDPRWRGAVNRSFGIGTAEETSFRALYHEDGGQRALYLSWHVKFDADPGSTVDRIFVMITPSSSGGSPLTLEMIPFNDTADHLTATPLHSILAGRRQTNGTTVQLANLPNWLNDTRAWRTGTGATQGTWAIHMRVPIDPNATDVDGNNGLRLTGSFRMWFEFRIKTTTRADLSNTDISTSGILTLNWPKGITLTGGGTVYPTSGSSETYNFGSIADPSCPANGAISLDYLDVGTTNQPDSYIHPTNTNTFFARPENKSSNSVGTGAINATFRLANWGSKPENAPWLAIQSGVVNSDIIPANTKANEDNDIRFNLANVGSYISDIANYPHQCMLVELSGPGLLFSNTSVYRNMDFVLNSKDTRTATISVESLKPISTMVRDVYLAVETINMPRQDGRDLGQFGPIMAAEIRPIDDNDREDLYFKVQRAQEYIKEVFSEKEHESPAARLALLLQAAQVVGINSEEFERLFPTYRVHVYHDTGETWKVDGQEYPLLALQSSFGFYAYHEGPVLGWNHTLRGAIRVAENFYVLRVPNDGTATITTIIHGIAPGEEEQIEPDEPIQEWPKRIDEDLPPEPDEPTWPDLLPDDRSDRKTEGCLLSFFAVAGVVLEMLGGLMRAIGRALQRISRE